MWGASSMSASPVSIHCWGALGVRTAPIEGESVKALQEENAERKRVSVVAESVSTTSQQGRRQVDSLGYGVALNIY